MEPKGFHWKEKMGHPINNQQRMEAAQARVEKMGDQGSQAKQVEVFLWKSRMIVMKKI